VYIDCILVFIVYCFLDFFLYHSLMNKVTQWTLAIADCNRLSHVRPEMLKYPDRSRQSRDDRVGRGLSLEGFVSVCLSRSPDHGPDLQNISR